jgi:hypothetical protein
VATQLQAQWREHAPRHTFLQQAGTTLPRFQQTDLAFLLPPRQRTKARYMALDDHVGWARHLLDYHDRGDFTLIGRACVFSARPSFRT